MPPEPGQRFGDYEVLGPLGAGGMGRVFKVRNIISNREEAMKILLPDYQADPDLAARFMAEIRTLATLDHPGIAQLRTAFQLENQLVMVMECVEGTTLENLAAQTRVPLKYALDFTSQVLSALGYAHAQGVTHRDIKPANIMITTHGLVKLMDFGIAKTTTDLQLTRPGTTMGSVYYMSPEQVLGNKVDARSDLYSLGVTLYELLAGRKPFQSDSSYTVLNAQLNQMPQTLMELSPDLPPELNAIVMKAMAKRPEDRFQSADQFKAAVQQVRDELGGVAAAAASKAREQTVPPVPDTEPVAVSNPAVFRPATAQGTLPPQPASTAPPQAPMTEEPQFTPVANVAPPPGAGSRPRRGLWIGVGVVAALLALAAVGIVGPKVFSTHAGQAAQNAAGSKDTASAPVVPASASPATEAAPVGGQVQVQPPAVQPAVRSAEPAAQAPVRSSGAARPGSNLASGAARPPIAAAPAASTAAPASVSSGPSEQQMREARDRVSSLQARADAAITNVQQMRSQQQAQGLDMRGDILAAMSRLQNDMREAQRALDRRDTAAADEYSGRADHEVETLEKFLGR